MYVAAGSVPDAPSSATHAAGAPAQSPAPSLAAASAPAQSSGKSFKVYMHYEPASETAKERAPLEAGGGGDVAMTHLFRWDMAAGAKSLSELLHEFCDEYVMLPSQTEKS